MTHYITKTKFAYLYKLSVFDIIAFSSSRMVFHFQFNFHFLNNQDDSNFS